MFAWPCCLVSVVRQYTVVGVVWWKSLFTSERGKGQVRNNPFKRVLPETWLPLTRKKLLASQICPC